MSEKDYISTPKKNVFEVSDENKQGFSCYETKGYRPTQEDSLVCLNGLEDISHLSPEEIGYRMWSTYQQLDASFTGQSGTTAASNYYDGKGNIVTATLADAASFAAIYGQDGKVLKVVRLNSITHKPSDPREKERIIALGGAVQQSFYGIDRVNGIIAVSRAIGDKTPQLQGFTLQHREEQKKPLALMTFADLAREERIPNGKPLIVAEAKIDITSIDSLTQGIEEEIGRIEMIVTCDGFTDGAGESKQEKMDHEAYLKQCLEKAPQGLQGKALCEFLANKAIKDGSKDNVSVAIQSIYSENAPRQEPVFLGVYDGHGGSEASVHVANDIGKVFRQQCALTENQYMHNSYSIYKNLPQFTRDHPEQNAVKLYNQKVEFILNKIDFDSNIQALIDQKERFQGRQQTAEVEAIDTLIDQLNSAQNNWKANPQNEKQFVNECQNALNSALQSPLKNYKESYWLINKLVTAINWLASFVKQDGPLIKTQSIKNIMHFKGALKENSDVQQDTGNKEDEGKEQGGKFSP